MRLVFDIETNGLLDNLQQFYSLVLADADSEWMMSCTNHSNDYHDLEEGLDYLTKADLIVGHNIQAFDNPAIKYFYPDFEHGEIFDTLLMSPVLWPNLMVQDAAFRKMNPNFPGEMVGKHSLKAWGYRLGMHKIQFDDFSKWTPTMQGYCEQDVLVTRKLFNKMLTKQISKTSVYLEHEFARIIRKQEGHGFPFNMDAALELESVIRTEADQLTGELREDIEPWYVSEGEFKPKRDNKRYGYIEGCPMTKVSLKEFNPNSDQQVADRLQKLYDWKPTQFTDTGLPAMGVDILKGIGLPITDKLARLAMLNKRLSQLADGDAAWLKMYNPSTGNIHGRMQTCGAVTGRCTHSGPNIAQVPAVRAEYGKECRSLFYAPPGWTLVGTDASGLELRCLAHYLYPYDGGEYVKQILEGDVHTFNQQLAGLETRDQAKTFIYAFLYGGGDEVLGAIPLPTGTSSQKKRAGSELRNNFQTRFEAVAQLKKDISKKVGKTGTLKGIDGRLLHVREGYRALNTLLQSAGGLTVKLATVIMWKNLEDLGWVFGREAAQVAHIHDEYQTLVRDDLVTIYGPISVGAITNAGRVLNFNCPLDGEYKAGKNWAETH